MGPHPNRRPILSLKSIAKATPPAPVAAPPAPVAAPPAAPELPPAASAILAKTEHKLAREAAVKWLSETYPLAFGVEVRALALGIGRQVWPRAKAAGVQRRALHAALKWRTSSFLYFDALIADSMRFDLEGNAVEPVSDEHRRRALEMKAERFERIRRERAESSKCSRP
jgi:sRNA-binding protein